VKGFERGVNGIVDFSGHGLAWILPQSAGRLKEGTALADVLAAGIAPDLHPNLVLQWVAYRCIPFVKCLKTQQPVCLRAANQP
jgi:hypothetical protein